MANAAETWLFRVAIKVVGTQRLYRAVASARRKELSLELSERCRNKVLSGPFKDMILPVERSWSSDGDFTPKIIGSYESNIHESMMNAIAGNPDIVINVGCAEGYYAVGLARLLPNAIVHAFDIDDRARTICMRAAIENGVADRVFVDGLCTTEKLSTIITSQNRIFIIMDCEGAEMELLDPEKVLGLSRCDVLVETHDFVAPGVTATLESRLGMSHDVTRISQAGRNPNEVQELAIYSESDRWLMVDEYRPAIMTWLACRARRV
jgi:hypothetical protein